MTSQQSSRVADGGCSAAAVVLPTSVHVRTHHGTARALRLLLCLRRCAAVLSQLGHRRHIQGCERPSRWVENPDGPIVRVGNEDSAWKSRAEHRCVSERLCQGLQGKGGRQQIIGTAPSGATARPPGSESAAAAPVPSLKPARPSPATVAI